MFKSGDTLKNGATVLDFDPKSKTVLATWNDKYVTWVSDADGATYWGHYFSTFEHAANDYKKRIGQRGKNPKEKRSRIISGIEYEVMFTGDGWRVMRIDANGVGHTEFNAGPGDAGRAAALLHLKGMRAKPTKKKKRRKKNPNNYSTPKTAAMRKFLKREAPHRVTGLSIEPDGVFIYTDSDVWSDDAGAGTFREDSETAAIKSFYERVQPSVKGNPIKQLMARKDLQAATRHFAQSVQASKKHSNVTRNALEKYGDHGPQISGVIRDHFPKHVKDELRKLARQVSEHSDAGYAARPKGVRVTTMRALSREVATQHGSGFYGPRPNPRKKRAKKKATRKKNPAKRFTQKQLATMRREYKKIRGVDPAGGTYEKMALYLDGLPQSLLKQLAGAKIKFLSGMARNRVKRKANPKGKNFVIFRRNNKGNVSFLLVNSQWGGKANKGRLVSNSKPYLMRIAEGIKAPASVVVGLAEKDMTAAEINKSFQVEKRPKSKRRRNPVGPTQREIDSAHDLFRDFTGEHPERLQNVRLPVPKTGLAIGELDGVLYTTVRDGKTEKYQHDFKKGSRPLLASSHDGKSLHILGGEYEFTERGIEDK